MHPLVIALIVAASVLLLGLALWLFMIWPGGRRKEMLKYTGFHYAHRGLHDDTKAENSLSAFAAAKERGYGIELDVRLSKDGELVVHHEERYRALLKNVEMAQVFEKSEVKVWECRNCGHIIIGEKAPEVCPTCDHPKAYFEIHAENY